MNCRQARRNLDLYLDGQLPPKQRWALEAHLSRCSRCRQAQFDLRQMARALDGWGPTPAPEALLPRVMDLVACYGTPRPGLMAKWIGIVLWAMGLVGTLAGLALMGVGSVFGPNMGLPPGTLSLAQEPDLALDSLTGSLGASIEGLVTLADRVLLGIPDLEMGLLLGGCLTLLGTGALILRALGQPQSARGGLAPKGGI